MTAVLRAAAAALPDDDDDDVEARMGSPSFRAALHQLPHALESMAAYIVIRRRARGSYFWSYYKQDFIVARLRN
jgi:hypothetical protein